MDEREMQEPCPSYQSTYLEGNISGNYGHIGGSISGAGGNQQINPQGRIAIKCPYGYTNCTEIGC